MQRDRARTIMKSLNTKHNQAKLNLEKEAEDFKFEIELRHEQEKLQKMDRQKTIDKLNRKLLYKKEVVLHKHLSHQLNNWSSKQKQMTQCENTSRVNFIMNRYKQSLIGGLKSSLKNNPSRIKGA